jgi:hypothetical protein
MKPLLRIIRRQNLWYDRLGITHPSLHFGIFFLPLLVSFLLDSYMMLIGKYHVPLIQFSWVLVLALWRLMGRRDRA